MVSVRVNISDIVDGNLNTRVVIRANVRVYVSMNVRVDVRVGVGCFYLCQGKC